MGDDRMPAQSPVANGHLMHSPASDALAGRGIIRGPRARVPSDSLRPAAPPRTTHATGPPRRRPLAPDRLSWSGREGEPQGGHLLGRHAGARVGSQQRVAIDAGELSGQRQLAERCPRQ